MGSLPVGWSDVGYDEGQAVGQAHEFSAGLELHERVRLHCGSLQQYHSLSAAHCCAPEQETASNTDGRQRRNSPQKSGIEQWNAGTAGSSVLEYLVVLPLKFFNCPLPFWKFVGEVFVT